MIDMNHCITDKRKKKRCMVFKCRLNVTTLYSLLTNSISVRVKNKLHSIDTLNN